jgi:hypothetical protein
MTEELLEAIQRRQRESRDAAHQSLMATITAGTSKATTADDDAGDDTAETFSAFAVRMNLNIDEMTAPQFRCAIALFDSLNTGKKRMSASSPRAEIVAEQYMNEVLAETIKTAREDALVARGNHSRPHDIYGEVMHAIHAPSNS